MITATISPRRLRCWFPSNPRPQHRYRNLLRRNLPSTPRNRDVAARRCARRSASRRAMHPPLPSPRKSRKPLRSRLRSRWRHPPLLRNRPWKLPTHLRRVVPAGGPAASAAVTDKFTIAAKQCKVSLPGLTRQSILSKEMDARIKSAHDVGRFCKPLQRFSQRVIRATASCISSADCA